MIRAKTDTEQANLKREQSYMQTELKRKQIETAAATEIKKQQIEANFKMQAIGRREIERYQEKKKKCWKENSTHEWS